MRKVVDGVISEMTSEEELAVEAEQKEHSEALRVTEERYGYRTKRAEEYAKQLGKGAPDLGDLERKIDAIGDVLDALLKHIQGDSVELNEIMKKVEQIKIDNPKPPRLMRHTT